MPLFGRQVILQVGQPGTEGLSWKGLRISFDVRKNLGRGANKASILAYNLSPQSIAKFQEPGAIIRLFAGHEIPRLIAQGTAIRNGVRGPEREGPDKVLTLEIQDGGSALVRTRLNLTFATETTGAQIFESVAAALGFPAGFVPPEFADVRLTQGVTLTGQASKVLDRLSDMLDTDITVRDGALEAISKTGDAGTSAVVLSTANRNLQRIIRKDKGIEVDAILDARIQPGRRFVVDSTEDASISGIYKARDVGYVGDTHSDAFTMTITAREAA